MPRKVHVLFMSSCIYNYTNDIIVTISNIFGQPKKNYENSKSWNKLPFLTVTALLTIGEVVALTVHCLQTQYILWVFLLMECL